MTLCLVVEDDPSHRALVVAALDDEGYEVAEADSAASCLRLLEQRRPEIVLLDLGLPDSDGLGLIPRFLECAPESRVIVLTGRDKASVAVAALRAGARHYLVKPVELEELRLVVGQEARSADAAELQRRTSPSELFWGSSPSMLQLRSQLDMLARSPLTPVLIEGETGTGKEVLARELQRLTDSSAPLVAVNCAAVPHELLESELFGHERGSFTGAAVRRRGLAELARGGTLFLDEIGEMPAAMQSKLLRFLQDHRFRRVGGEAELTSRCRVVAATHRDLGALQQTGSFREDLYYRLAVVCLRVPPLRQRQRDLLSLARSLLLHTARHLGRAPTPLSPAAERAMLEHDWPGNVRELKNRLERALVLTTCAEIGPLDLDLPSRRPWSRSEEAPDVESARLRKALEESSYNISKTARVLGVRRHWLRYRMVKHGLGRPEE